MTASDPKRTLTMPIVTDENGFYSWPDASETPALGIETERLQDCIDEAVSRGLTGVFGTVPYFQGGDLDFLRQLPGLASVQFWGVPISDLRALYDLTHLRFLRLSDCKRPGLDFGQLSQLQKLVWDFSKKDTGSNSLSNLTFLHLWRYKSSSGDMSDMALPPNISELGIFWCNAKSLDGITPLPSLRHLEIERCRNLESITALGKSCPNLEHLVVSASGRVTAEEGERLACQLPRVQHLYAGNKKIR